MMFGDDDAASATCLMWPLEPYANVGCWRFAQVATCADRTEPMQSSGPRHQLVHSKAEHTNGHIPVAQLLRDFGI
jgi:hypothetical protein